MKMSDRLARIDSLLAAAEHQIDLSSRIGLNEHLAANNAARAAALAAIAQAHATVLAAHLAVAP